MLSALSIKFDTTGYALLLMFFLIIFGARAARREDRALSVIHSAVNESTLSVLPTYGNIHPAVPDVGDARVQRSEGRRPESAVVSGKIGTGRWTRQTGHTRPFGMSFVDLVASAPARLRHRPPDTLAAVHRSARARSRQAQQRRRHRFDDRRRRRRVGHRCSRSAGFGLRQMEARGLGQVRGGFELRWPCRGQEDHRAQPQPPC